MTVSRAERFRLKSAIIDELGMDRWSRQKIEVLFAEFGLEPGPYDEIHDALVPVSDDDLTELYAAVMGTNLAQVQDELLEAQGGNWSKGQVRVFISHSAKHKAFTAQVANELGSLGIHGFVAHDTMRVSLPWQKQIEEALRTMDVLVAIVHPEFNDSAFCHQEVGWAMGRRVPYYAVRVDKVPGGFIGSDQWPNVHDGEYERAADFIYDWLVALPGIGEPIAAGLFDKLRTAPSFDEAGVIAARLVRVKALAPDQWKSLDDAILGNFEVRGSRTAERALKPFYEANGREYPPARSDLRTPLGAEVVSQGSDLWALPSSGEPPF